MNRDLPGCFIHNNNAGNNDQTQRRKTQKSQTHLCIRCRECLSQGNRKSADDTAKNQQRNTIPHTMISDELTKPNQQNRSCNKRKNKSNQIKRPQSGDQTLTLQKCI